MRSNLERHLKTVGCEVDSGKKAAEWRRDLQQVTGSALLHVLLLAPLCFRQFRWFPRQEALVQPSKLAQIVNLFRIFLCPLRKKKKLAHAEPNLFFLK